MLLKAVFTGTYFDAGILIVRMNSSYLNVNLKDQVCEKGSTNDSRPIRPLLVLVVKISVLGILVILHF